MTWINFPLYALITILLTAAGVVILFLPERVKFKMIIGNILLFCGVFVLGCFIALLWMTVARPPLRTLGETRLWYSFFILVLGLIIWFRWKYKWFMIITTAFAGLFLLINYMNPEGYDKALMPALQSPWFIPHVIVYILAYAILAVSSLVGFIGLYKLYFKEYDDTLLHLGDNLVYIGFAFLTFGLIFGALWAKVAWGHYWTWDPKETWAFLTWFAYLIYMHFRFYQPKKIKVPLWTLSLAFIILLICWFGINYLPSAQNSVHIYAR